MTNNQIQKLLIDSGLHEKEAAVYLSALSLGESSILAIANDSKIKRSTVYEVLPSLIEKGLIKTTKHGTKIRFSAENPKAVAELVSEKEKRLKEAMPELMALYKSQDARPQIFFYEGKDEVQKMYEDTIREGKPLLNFTSIINLYSYLDEAWVNKYIDNRIKSKITTQIIALDSPEAREWVEKQTEELRQIKLVPQGNFIFSGDIHIYGEKVIITTYKKSITAVQIEDQNISTMLRMMFQMLWDKY